MKRIAICMLVMLLAGCPAQVRRATQIDPATLAGKDPVCTRGCVDSYSACAGQASRSSEIVMSREILAGCKSAADACISTCGAAK